MYSEIPYRVALLVVIALTMSVTGYHRLQAAKSGETISRLTTIIVLTATVLAAAFQPVTCEVSYPHHLQGVCVDEQDSIFWSFTTKLGVALTHVLGY